MTDKAQAIIEELPALRLNDESFRFDEDQIRTLCKGFEPVIPALLHDLLPPEGPPGP